MLKGLQGCIYAVPSLAEAVSWYSKVFETSPQRESSRAVEFWIDGFQLILVPQTGETSHMQGGVTACWGVTDLAAEVERVQALGATLIEPAHCLLEGLVQVTLLDPYGNRLGLVTKQ